MTEFLGYTDGYKKEFEAVVQQVNPAEKAFSLDQTIFYPGGGGQPCDLGEIQCDGRSLPVLRVKGQEDGIWHFVEGELPQVGSTIYGKIDWQRRYQLMRTHTAMHVLCGVVWRDYQASVTGGNIEPLQARMDFEFETMHKDLVQVIEENVAIEITAAHPVISRLLPREEAFQIPDLIRTKINLLPSQIQKVRIVEIHGLDLQACGGTHLSNTREIGHLRVVDYKSKGKINKRIIIEVTD